MKTLQFTYEMRTSFEASVWDHHYTLKCIPVNSERQKVEQFTLKIEPAGTYEWSEDSFHNAMVFGCVPEAHDSFAVAVRGRAVTGLARRETVREPARLGSFLVQSVYTDPGDGLKQYYETVSCCIGKMERPYDKALSIMENLGKTFRYCQGVTNVATTAEEAWKLGCGVCQDWCHIMLGLCRMAGIPCRYVVGMLTGEGYSHAWVEIAEEGFWYALDPTNQIVVEDGHIKISDGRDYHDCMVARGIFRGGAVRQSQQIRVAVKEVTEEKRTGRNGEDRG